MGEIYDGDDDLTEKEQITEELAPVKPRMEGLSDGACNSLYNGDSSAALQEVKDAQDKSDDTFDRRDVRFDFIDGITEAQNELKTAVEKSSVQEQAIYEERIRMLGKFSEEVRNS